VAAGTLIGTAALPEESGSATARTAAVTATATNGSYVLEGTAAFVPDLGGVDAVVVTAQLEGQPSLFVVDRQHLLVGDGLALDPTRPLASATLNGVSVAADRLLGGEPCSWATIDEVRDRATAILCAEMCGGAQKVLDLSVEYARSRTQFGRPIGSFQGVSHRCAEMLLSIESTRSLTYYAAWCCDNDQAGAALATSAAKARAGDMYRTATAQAIQVHGGIGFTWETGLHLWYRRALWCAACLGDSVHHRERVAALIGL
jgi:alkylation response protein AidB-like acyl-CoA dehydrogenase